MNKSELIETLAAKTEVSKAAAAKSVDALVEIITAAVAKGDDVALIGFGTFKSANRAARTGRNPKTGAALKIAASTVPKFSAGAAFKTAVAGKKAAKPAPKNVAAKVSAVKSPAAKKPVAKKK
jgi:DNA-binding protein HU-beta